VKRPEPVRVLTWILILNYTKNTKNFPHEVNIITNLYYFYLLKIQKNVNIIKLQLFGGSHE